MFFKLLAIVPFALGSFVLTGIWGGWALINPNDPQVFWSGLALVVVAYGLTVYLWYLSRLGAPVTAVGHHARTMTAALMVKNIGYLIIIAVILFAATPVGQGWVSHYLLHKP